ncbi:MAG: DNA polymerase III subunit alpha [Cytophagales bacterium CG12_big_fil_rev_8_21_14_0_65_40_12]|nr:MAG: DNA polymerase III subunit alpha [Cytophagales bacterium CG12_big_fil_rev_8_21_14_0_65_40_12]PIW03873.1 MAG: DNA polymerase III subunit alpha [Cytophagales bacterium CG17_big_fil_post_rev_8_21_14_2_50_40_13]
MYLIFDTETTGLPKNYNAPVSDLENWPRLVQLAWQLHDAKGKLISAQNFIVKPEGFTIPYNSQQIHGISTERALEEGQDLNTVLGHFSKDLAQAEVAVGHNIEFDLNIVGAEYLRAEKPNQLESVASIDTKEVATDFCAIPGGRGGKFKWPTLTELHQKLFGEGFGDAHDAAYDVDATSRCFFGLIKASVVVPLGGVSPSEITYEPPKLAAANFAKTDESSDTGPGKIDRATLLNLEEVPFTHLHCHSQFSILQATSELSAMVNTAKEMNMPAIALTDHGNMMGAFQFVKAALALDIKPIVGCEFNICIDRSNKKLQDNGTQTVLLAKNKAGYHNLVKLSSIAYTEGFYYLPRIDKNDLLKFKGDLIATTGGLWGEVPYLILNVGETQAEEAFVWWKEQFGDDFYAEIQRHGLLEEDHVNTILLQLCKKHDVKYIATNNSYYTRKDQAEAHDVLLCVKDAESVTKPKKYIGKRGREFRYGFPNDEFYIKSPEEMKKLFTDLPEAITNTNEIVEKVEAYKLEREVLLPKFDIPQEFQSKEDEADGGKRGENNYLKHLTYIGAKKRYPEMTPEIQERLDFELETIANTGYPGYFLIVQDFTNKAREMDVAVGPGRGSAAGSAVAYCTGITNVDPIKYDLLFERFLNPDRVSLPDIDIDFDDEGRQKVIDYVINKYGKNQVAQIITYGTMAAKSSIRDTARVMELPLPDADRIAKLVPDVKLAKLFAMSDKEMKDQLKSDQVGLAHELKKLAAGNDATSRVINQARILEGSVRNTGIHACGVIITPDDITNFAPVATAKDSDMWCTQFDNSVVESAGLLKMDFLGLKTLTLIKDAVKNVKEKHNIDLVPDDFPLDDPKTYELFQKGETVGIFQYESNGMQKYLRDLKPTAFADLIAMNALYRPGPLEYIPSFVRRKNGEEEVSYDLEDMKEYLEETYGITVYQEQVMLLSQKLAGFTKGEADVLRKAMGKKQRQVLDKMKPKFVEQASAKGHDAAKLEKIWRDWEAFASYAFNKSHSTCYAYVAFQTAYLKAHYPAEYMASVLSNNMNDIKQVTFFMEECQRMGVAVLGPDVNESNYKFTVNKKGEIRFGMGAIKGVGEAAIESIILERKEKGPYKNIFEFAERVNLRAVNKKNFESLAMAGGFDCFEEFHRRQYLWAPENEQSLIEKVIRYANSKQAEKDASQVSLFGGDSNVATPLPRVMDCEPFSEMEKLKIEKDVVGFYISGHPLDQFEVELESFCKPIADIKKYPNQDISIGGIVSGVRNGQTKNGKPFAVLSIEDYNSSVELFLMGEKYMNNAQYLRPGEFLFITGRVELNWRKKNEIRDNPHINPTPEDWELQTGAIALLSELREKRSKGIRVTVNARDVDQNFIDLLSALAKEHEGQTQLRIQLVEKSENISVELLSRKIKVDPNSKLIRTLKKLAHSAQLITN